jgi:hypothetical protein
MVGLPIQKCTAAPLQVSQQTNMFIRRLLNCFARTNQSIAPFVAGRQLERTGLNFFDLALLDTTSLLHMLKHSRQVRQDALRVLNFIETAFGRNKPTTQAGAQFDAAFAGHIRCFSGLTVLAAPQIMVQDGVIRGLFCLQILAQTA